MTAAVTIADPAPPARPEWHSMLVLAWPLIASNLVMQLINATDVILMGWLGKTALAATALGLGLCFVFSLFGMGLATAAAPMMATALGRRANAVREVRRSFRMAMWMAVAFGLVSVLVMGVAEPIIVALGQDPVLAAQAAVFLDGYRWTVPAFLLFQVMRQFLSAIERPGWILLVSLAGVVLNMLVGWALIFGRLGLPAMGIRGGGIASAVVWWAMTLTLALVLVRARHFRRWHLFGRWWRIDGSRLRALLRLGLPIGASFALEGAVFSAAAYLMGMIGTAALAAHQVAIQIAATTFMVPVGIGQAATVRVGRALGAGDRAAIGRAGRTALWLGVGFMALMAAIMLLFARPLMTLFLDDSTANADVIALGSAILLVAAAFQIVDGAQAVLMGMLRGLHDTRLPMLFAAAGYWGIGIGVGALLAFGAGWGGVGVWTGLAVGLGIVALLLGHRWHRRDRLAAVRAIAAAG